ncbi:MAG: metallophosphoesterase [Candidatus Marinimicrobia bacterium]|nr:metallophosphoesterase [Candidatus Neomarinimicrobiota bacterium]
MIFLIMVLMTLALLHGYVGMRLIPTLGFSGGWQIIAWGLLILLTFLPIAPILMRMNGIENKLTDRLSWFGYTSLGFFTLIFLLVIVRDFGWSIWVSAAKLIDWSKDLLGFSSAHLTNFNPARRQFVVTAMNLGLLSLTSGLSAYGLYQARREPTVLDVDIPIKNLPPELEGLRIVQISDIHVGPTIKRAFVQRVVDQVQSLKPDLIALTGDLVDGSVSHLSNDVAPLADLQAPFGKFFVTGNHEYYSGVEHWLEQTDRLGFTNLLNEHRVLDINGAKLTIAGVTDLSARSIDQRPDSDPVKALHQAPFDSIKLLLAHQPNSIYAAEELGVDLQLSGHTHGGQFKPFNLVVARAHSYLAGLYNHKGTWVYVNRGTGYWGPPLRLGIPNEITVLRLVKAMNN